MGYEHCCSSSLSVIYQEASVLTTNINKPPRSCVDEVGSGSRTNVNCIMLVVRRQPPQPLSYPNPVWHWIQCSSILVSLYISLSSQDNMMGFFFLSSMTLIIWCDKTRCHDERFTTRPDDIVKFMVQVLSLMCVVLAIHRPLELW